MFCDYCVERKDFFMEPKHFELEQNDLERNNHGTKRLAKKQRWDKCGTGSRRKPIQAPSKWYIEDQTNNSDQYTNGRSK